MDYNVTFENIKNLYQDILQGLNEPKIDFNNFVENIEKNKGNVNQIFDDNKLTYPNLEGLKTQINKHIGKIYSISKALKELEDFKQDNNYKNHKNYLEYIKNIIFLKIYIDLRTFKF